MLVEILHFQFSVVSLVSAVKFTEVRLGLATAMG